MKGKSLLLVITGFVVACSHVGVYVGVQSAGAASAGAYNVEGPIKTDRDALKVNQIPEEAFEKAREQLGLPPQVKFLIAVGPSGRGVITISSAEKIEPLNDYVPRGTKLENYFQVWVTSKSPGCTTVGSGGGGYGIPSNCR